jgi:hypothetical protein
MGVELTPAERYQRACTLGIIVDPEDVWLFSALTWRISSKGYAYSTMYSGTWRKSVMFHHFIMGTPIWSGQMTDHINRNKLDNRRQNLRWVNGYVNSQNTYAVDNAANVCETYNGKFQVAVQRNGVKYHIGTYDTMQEAINDRDTWFKAYTNT